MAQTPVVNFALQLLVRDEQVVQKEVKQTVEHVHSKFREGSTKFTCAIIDSS